MLDTEAVYEAVGSRLTAKNATRWDSQLKAFRSIVDALDKDPQLQSKLNATTKKHAKLSLLEIKRLKEVILILTPFKEATDDFQGDYETAGIVVPAYLDLLNKMTLEIVDSNGATILNPVCPLAGKITLCKALANDLKSSLVKRLGSVLHETVFVVGKPILSALKLIPPTILYLKLVFITILIAAFLDSRFKDGWVEFSGLNKGDVIACVRAELDFRYRKLKDEGEWEQSSSGSAGSSGESSPCNDNPPDGIEQPAKKARTERQLYSTLKRTSRAPSAGLAKILEEFDIFIQEPVSPMDVMPLKFWLENRYRFPHLSAVARNIFGIPASSGSVERCFSVALDIIGIKRGSLKAELFNQLLFIKRNRDLK